MDLELRGWQAAMMWGTALLLVSLTAVGLSAAAAMVVDALLR